MAAHDSWLAEAVAVLVEVCDFTAPGWRGVTNFGHERRAFTKALDPDDNTDYDLVVRWERRNGNLVLDVDAHPEHELVISKHVEEINSLPDTQPDSSKRSIDPKLRRMFGGRLVPFELAEELGRWNEGKGITIQEWTDAEGNFDLFFGYSTILWPRFELVNDCILTEGWTEKKLNALISGSYLADSRTIERELNQRNILYFHQMQTERATIEHMLHLGETLKETYTAKLNLDFPDRPCTVEFFVPDRSLCARALCRHILAERTG
ncbi:MAG: hypothetical protein QNJ35_00635 [Paracoccaceae bacterium]|nr:hypothetical protein [Paracoccaceae bacterium]